MSGHTTFRYTAVVAFLICYTTILLGGNVMASDSGLACPDWPTCHGTLLPALAGPTGIEYAHRIAGFLLAVSILFLAILALVYEARRPVLRKASAAALGLVVGQALLGGLVVESSLGVGLVLTHLALATALFGLLLFIAMLANLREIPPHWIAWLQRASGEEAGRSEPGGLAEAPASGWEAPRAGEAP
ncbi:MAG TPA: COX15/CtaA family protein [Thermoplasmata archaeon]|nr:COX15/CtaA family protein [Thermoplasmata archaeon]